MLQMKKILSERKEALKEQGCDLKFDGLIHGKNVKITLVKGEKQAQIIIKELGEMSATLRFDEKMDEELTYVLLEQVEYCFEEWGVPAIALTTTCNVESKGYVLYDGKWMKSIGEEKLFIKFLKYVTFIMKEIQEENEDFSFELQSAQTKRKLATLIEFKTLYQQNWLHIGWEEDKVISYTPFSYDDITEKKHNKDEFYTYLKQWFKQNEIYNKMQTIYDKKHPYFYQFLEETDCFRFLETIKENISSHLREYMSYEEVEKIAKQKMEEKKPVLKYKKNGEWVALIPFGSCFIWSEVKEGPNGKFDIKEFGVHGEEEKESIIKRFQEEVASRALGKEKTAIFNEL